MTITPSGLRAIYPEFNDPAKYQDAAVQFWLNQAYSNMNAIRWANNLDLGAMLFTCHQLAIGQRRAQAAARGGVPGAPVGVMTSKGVGPASASYDVQSITEADAGYFNSTDYGIQYYNLMMQAGSGGAFVNGFFSTGGTGSPCPPWLP